MRMFRGCFWLGLAHPGFWRVDEVVPGKCGFGRAFHALDPEVWDGTCIY